jgi:murein DD-endopeptidase MepM/ murein hydrolase activator NlpD
MKILFFAYLLCFLIATKIAFADIYRYVSKDGVECYTDRPLSKKSVLVFREPRKKATKPKSANLTAPKKNALASSSDRSKKSFVLPVNGVISSTVGLRYDPIDGTLRNHNGVDIAVPQGTPVKPVASGVVAYSGIRGGYGNIVIVEHDGGMTTLYAHNHVNLVATGDRVGTNTTIASSGSTGRSTGPHLHFEAWLGSENITEQVLDNPSCAWKYSIAEGILKKSNPVRKIIMADGTILLTNLPLMHP